MPLAQSSIPKLIEHGTLRPGERVPSVRKCSAHQNVSIATVTQAYRLLEDRGLIEARPQSGYYVRTQRWTPPPEPAMTNPSPRAVAVHVSDLCYACACGSTVSFWRECRLRFHCTPTR